MRTVEEIEAEIYKVDNTEISIFNNENTATWSESTKGILFLAFSIALTQYRKDGIIGKVIITNKTYTELRGGNPTRNKEELVEANATFKDFRYKPRKNELLIPVFYGISEENIIRESSELILNFTDEMKEIIKKAELKTAETEAE